MYICCFIYRRDKIRLASIRLLCVTLLSGAAGLALPPVAHAEVDGSAVIFFLREGWLWHRLFRRAEPIPGGEPRKKTEPRTGGRGKIDRKGMATGRGRAAVAYCVRLCDGRFFPMAQSRRGLDECRTVWPDDDAAIYFSSSLDKGIDAARAASGSPYASLPNAYAYRRKSRSECAPAVTRRRDPLGDIANDATLKRGDVVVLPSELAVFLGQRDLPYSLSRFAPVAQFRGLPKSLRWTLQQLEIQALPDAPPPQPEDLPVQEARHAAEPIRAATACGAGQDRGFELGREAEAGAASAMLVSGEPVSAPGSSAAPCR